MDDQKPSKPITESKVLAVEGKDEEKLFSALRAYLNLPNIEIRELGGRYSFRAKISALKATSGFAEKVTSLGVVRDADENPAGAFQSVCDALEKASLPRPTAPLQPVGDAPQVMILPDGETPGMLEDLCLRSVAEDPAMPCVDEYFRCLEERLEELPKNPSKAQVRAFLASREWLEEAHFEYLQRLMEEYLTEFPGAPSVAKAHAFLASRYKPDLDLGIAAKEGYWRFDHPAFAQVKQFLKTL